MVRKGESEGLPALYHVYTHLLLVFLEGCQILQREVVQLNERRAFPACPRGLAPGGCFNRRGGSAWRFSGGQQQRLLQERMESVSGSIRVPMHSHLERIFVIFHLHGQNACMPPHTGFQKSPCC